MEINRAFLTQSKEDEQGLTACDCTTQKKLQKAAYMCFCKFSATPE